MNHTLHLLTAGLPALLFPLGAAAVSPYIATVHDYRPAPGQFVNEMPEYEDGDTYADILAKVADNICGEARPGLITLGAYGGYVTFSFDHRILNKPGDYDLRVNGNAFISDTHAGGGACEPGIILVSVDENGNGLPDDTWYEIRGSEYDNPATIHDFSITYTLPSAGHQAVPDPDNKHVIDTQYIAWTSNDASNPSGYLPRVDYHTQPYWPQWLSDDEQILTFSGECLPPNAVSIGGQQFLLKMLGEGYADNMPSVESHGLLDPGVKIDWAVKADGTPANLPGIDFVRVYTALNQTCGSLGETSTEVSGAEDLHPDYSSVATVRGDSPAVVLLPSAHGTLSVRSGFPESKEIRIVSADGVLRATATITSGDNLISLPSLPRGIYIVALPDGRALKATL